MATTAKDLLSAVTGLESTREIRKLAQATGFQGRVLSRRLWGDWKASFQRVDVADLGFIENFRRGRMQSGNVASMRAQ